MQSMLIVAPHSHVDGWHTREEGQPLARVDGTLLPSLPHPHFVKTTTTELYTTSRYKKRKEVDAYPRGVVHWKDVEHDIILGQPIMICHGQCTIKHERPTHDSTFGRPCRTAGEDHDPRRIFLQRTIRRDQNVSGIERRRVRARSYGYASEVLVACRCDTLLQVAALLQIEGAHQHQGRPRLLHKVRRLFHR